MGPNDIQVACAYEAVVGGVALSRVARFHIHAPIVPEDIQVEGAHKTIAVQVAGQTVWPSVVLVIDGYLACQGAS